MTSTRTLTDTHILIVGGTSGIGLEVARRAIADGARVTLAGRDPEGTEQAARRAGVAAGIATVDLGNEASIRTLAAELGGLDGVVSLAANHANGPVAGLEPAAIHAALDAKVVGPILLAKHLELAEHAALVLFSGFVAWRPAPGLAVMAAANAAASALADALAIELAPRRVLAVSPGIIDSGAWDDAEPGFLAQTAAGLPVGRVGETSDVAAAVLLALTNPFLTATTLHVDGGARIA